MASLVHLGDTKAQPSTKAIAPDCDYGASLAETSLRISHHESSPTRFASPASGTFAVTSWGPGQRTVVAA